MSGGKSIGCTIPTGKQSTVDLPNSANEQLAELQKNLTGLALVD